MSASIVADEKCESSTAREPKPMTASRSLRGLAATNARAAAIACSSDSPAIERERSIARTTLFSRDRFRASTSTGEPFSSSRGGFASGRSVTSVTCSSGQPEASRPLSAA